MLRLNRQRAAQILVIDDREVRRFVWESGILGFDRAYSHDEPGLDEYKADMPLFDQLPVIIVTDFVEENFRNENIVHVNRYDRSAILQRRLHYIYRHTPFRSARITGRESQGRRDDNILFSAITKPELIQPWIDTLVATGMYVQSITSTAYLLEDYVRHSNQDSKGDLLIINIDRGQKLRQTFLRNGRVVFSRSTLFSGNDNDTISQDIYTESQRIRRYLERIHLLSHESVLQVRVYSLRDTQSLRFNPALQDPIRFQVINCAEQIATERVALGEHKPGSMILFLLETLRKQPIANIYAPFATRRYHHLRTIARGCFAASFLIIVSTLFLKLPALMDIIDNRQQLDTFQAQANPVNARYRALRAALPEMPLPPREMGLIVQRAEQIDASAAPSGAVLSQISAAIEGAAQLHLTSIEWHLLSAQQNAALLTARYGVTPDAAEPSLTQVLINGFAAAAGNYRTAQNQVLSFINQLDDIPGASVTPLQMPTDARSDTRVTTTVNDRQVSAPFSLRLTLEGPAG